MGGLGGDRRGHRRRSPRRGADREEFPRETTAPAKIAIDGPPGSLPTRRGVRRLTAAIAGDPTFGRPKLETNPGADVAILTLPIAGDPLGSRAIDSVRELREKHIPWAFAGTGADVFVGGDTATEIDEVEVMKRWLPIVVALVLGLSFVLLTAAFRSLVVAAKAVAINLLSAGAAYGLLVLVFQKGVGTDALGLQRVDSIESWLPLFLFAVLFGLSMDYHVFLLSRIRERFLQTGDNSAAVAHGVVSRGRTITGAALIVVAVFSGFAAGELVMFQQMGFGVGVALLLDATIVRLVLVPAAMELLGERNWYLPSWLERLPDVHIEGDRAGAAPSEA